MARRSGSGSVFQRKSDGQWIAQISAADPLTGKIIPRRKVTTSEYKARELLKELKRDGGSLTSPGEKITMKDYAERWMEVTLPTLGLSPKTEAMNKSRIKSSIIGQQTGDKGNETDDKGKDTKGKSKTKRVPRVGVGKVYVGKMKPATVEAFCKELRTAKSNRGKPLAPSSQRIDFDILSKILRTAVRDGLLKSNPCDEVSRPRVGRTEVQVHTAAQVDLILAASSTKPVGPLVRFVADTGCRIGEALGLRWTDVDLEKKQAKIVRGGVDASDTKTYAGRRMVPLLPEVVDALKQRKEEQQEYAQVLGGGWGNDRGLVFTTRTGTPLQYRNVSRALLSVIDQVNKADPDSEPIATARPWHTFRHVIVTRLLNNGVPMPVVSAIAGHASIRTTVDIYGHPEAAISAEALAGALGRSR